MLLGLNKGRGVQVGDVFIVANKWSEIFIECPRDVRIVRLSRAEIDDLGLGPNREGVKGEL